MRHLLSFPRLATQTFGTATRRIRNQVPEKQKFFQFACSPYEMLWVQEDNGLPVHIKGGLTDVLLYRLTMAITLGGTAFSCYWLLVACQPKGKKQ